MNRFPQGPRARTPSGHDIPIPESVFLALSDIQHAQQAQAQQTLTWQANHDSEHKDLGETVKKIAAGQSHDWVKIIGAIAAAIPLIVGGVRMTTPAQLPAEVRAVRSQADLDLDECRPLAPGSFERAECFERVSRGPNGKRSAP